ncbi:hypothetical protein D3C85_1368390 [compost metagenome]
MAIVQGDLPVQKLAVLRIQQCGRPRNGLFIGTTKPRLPEAPDIRLPQESEELDVDRLVDDARQADDFADAIQLPADRSIQPAVLIKRPQCALESFGRLE